MTITRTGAIGPAAATTGTLTLNWSPTAPAAGDLVVLDVVALSGQAMPATVPGFETVFTNGSGGGYVSAQYKRIADGTETGGIAVLTATTMASAAATYWHTDAAGKECDVAGSWGADADDAATGVSCTAGTSTTTVVGDFVTVTATYASSSPSFPTQPAGPTGRLISQTGATFAAIQNRSGLILQTNHRQVVSDSTVTAGATAPLKWVNNTTTASLRGMAVFGRITEVDAVAPFEPYAVTASADQTNIEPFTTVNVSASVPSGRTPDTWTWTQDSGPAVTLTGTGSSRSFVAPADPDARTVVLRVTVSEGEWTSAPDTVSVSVNPHLRWKPDGLGGWAPVRIAAV